MKEDGTYHTYTKTMIYHTFLVVMLGSRLPGKMVEYDVSGRHNSLLFHRDFSEKFTPVQNGEIQSEGIYNDEAASIEVVSLYYTPKEVEDAIKDLYLHLLDDTTHKMRRR